jgi:hypothetical protein
LLQYIHWNPFSRFIVALAWFYGATSHHNYLKEKGKLKMDEIDALSNFSAFFGHSIFGISLGIYAQILLKKFNLLSDGWK